MNVSGGVFTDEYLEKMERFSQLMEQYGWEPVVQEMDSLRRRRNQELAAANAASAEDLAEKSGLLGFHVARLVNWIKPVMASVALFTDLVQNTGRYDTADPYNWAFRFGLYGKELDDTNAALAGKRIVNFLETAARATDFVNFGPGAVDIDQPNIAYDTMGNLGIQGYADKAGEIGYSVMADQADNAIREAVKMVIASFGAGPAASLFGIGHAGAGEFIDTYQESSEAGIPRNQAIWKAAKDAGIEMLMEAVPFGELFTGNDPTYLWEKVLSSGMEEAIEEGVGGTISSLMDIPILGEDAKLVQLWNEAKSQNLSDWDAIRYIRNARHPEYMNSMGMAALGGMAGGITSDALDSLDINTTAITSNADSSKPVLGKQGDTTTSSEAQGISGGDTHTTSKLMQQTAAEPEVAGNTPNSEGAGHTTTEIGSQQDGSQQTQQTTDEKTGGAGTTQADTAKRLPATPQGAAQGNQANSAPQTSDPTQNSGLGRDTETGQIVDAAKQRMDILAEKIRKSGLTPGQAQIAAQRMEAASQRYGMFWDLMLEAYEPGQDPRQFTSSFEQAFRLGRDGKKEWLDQLASTRSLTGDQRALAYDIGVEMQNEPWTELPYTRMQNLARNIPTRGTKKLTQGFAAFADSDPANRVIDRLIPEEGKFDVALRGSPTAVAFGSENANMSARLLAQIIKRSEGYQGQPVRLLSDCTGYALNGNFSFAQELANALGVPVYAPNDLIFFFEDGIFRIGKKGIGSLIGIEPQGGT